MTVNLSSTVPLRLLLWKSRSVLIGQLQHSSPTYEHVPFKFNPPIISLILVLRTFQWIISVIWLCITYWGIFKILHINGQSEVLEMHKQYESTIISVQQCLGGHNVIHIHQPLPRRRFLRAVSFHRVDVYQTLWGKKNQSQQLERPSFRAQTSPVRFGPTARQFT